MAITTLYNGQNIERKIVLINTNSINQESIMKLLSDRSHLAKVTEVIDLEMGRASRSAKHVKKYLSQKSLLPFEILINKN